MKVQRDRGRRKKHHKAEPKQAPHDHADDAEFFAFQTWLRDEFRDENGAVITPSSSFNLTKYLQTCPWFELSPAEKLRWLAVFWESDCVTMLHPRGWNILKRIYQEAIRYAPDHGYNYHSYSLSAKRCAECVTAGSVQQLALLDDAKRVCLIGLEQDPDCSLLHYSLGLLLQHSGEMESAIRCFQSALKLDPKEMWAALSLAHCYFDLKRWKDAVDAYVAVDPSFFAGPSSWRAILLRWELATCHFHAGDHEVSLALFEKAFSQYEMNPGLLRSLCLRGHHVQQAADLFPDAFAQRVGDLLEQEFG